MADATLRGHRGAALEAIQAELAPLAGWTIAGSVDFSARPIALDICYEPDVRRVSIQTSEHQSTNPADYADHASATSELLQLLCALLNANFVHIGDIGWYIDNYHLMKVCMYYLDRRALDLSLIRINADDDEQWDYVNVDLDAEIKGYSR